MSHSPDNIQVSDKRSRRLRAVKAAFPRTVPVMAGYVFLGISYGVLMGTKGFPFYCPILMAFTIYGGSLEILAVSMLMSKFAPLQALIMSLLIQMRHLFYGISMLDKYRNMGWKKFPLIYGLSDETFAVNYMAEVPKEADRGWFYLWVTWLDRFYWVAGAAIGGILGNAIHFRADGLDFVMTTMFLVIFLDQWKKEDNHWSSLIGVLGSVACLLIFGADHFLLPTMACILILLTALRKPLSRRQKEETEADAK